MQSWAENLPERQLASEKSHAVKTGEKSNVVFKHLEHESAGKKGVEGKCLKF